MVLEIGEKGSASKRIDAWTNAGGVGGLLNSRGQVEEAVFLNWDFDESKISGSESSGSINREILVKYRIYSLTSSTHELDSI